MVGVVYVWGAARGRLEAVQRVPVTDAQRVHAFTTDDGVSEWGGGGWGGVEGRQHRSRGTRGGEGGHYDTLTTLIIQL